MDYMLIQYLPEPYNHTAESNIVATAYNHQQI